MAALHALSGLREDADVSASATGGRCREGIFLGKIREFLWVNRYCEKSCLRAPIPPI